MTEAERIEIEAACYRLVTAYCHLVDHGEAARIPDLFTDDGVWTAGPTTMSGRKELERGFQARQDDVGRASRHVCDNFLLHDVNADEARGTVYLTLYRHDGDPGRALSPLPGPFLVGEYRDVFVRTGAGWRRSLEISFLRAED